MSLLSFRPAGRRLSFILSLALSAALFLHAPVAMAQVAALDAVVAPSEAETCVAVFTVMAYAYADDDLKERQLEEKKGLARADIGPQRDAVSTGLDSSAGHPADLQSPAPQPQSSQDRIQQTMDSLTEMMLNAPAQAQGIAKTCFQKYPPAIELN